MDAIRIDPRVRGELLAHARDDFPRECCGLLLGRGAHIDESIRCANVDPDPNRYRLDPAMHIAANRRLRGSGRAVLGVYHSHPHSSPIPSRTDHLEAYYSEFVWIIVSLTVPDAEAIAAFRLTATGFAAVPMED
jgi:proteasome lid subunit RPN8/RPN11